MKKLGIYLMMLAMMAVTFVACSGDDPEMNDPRILITPAEIVVDVEKLAELKIDVTVVADEELTLVEAYIRHSALATPLPVRKVTEFDKGVKTWEGSFGFADLPADLMTIALVEGNMTFWVEAKTATTSSEKSAPITIEEIEKETDLTNPSQFVIGHPAHGTTLKYAMGIEYDQNPTTTTARFITRDRSNSFVMLTETEYNAIETVEGLARVFDAAETKTDRFTVNHPFTTPQHLIVKDGTTIRLVKMTALQFVPGENKATFVEQH